MMHGGNKDAVRRVGRRRTMGSMAVPGERRARWVQEAAARSKFEVGDDLHAMRPEEAEDNDKEAVEAEDDDKGNDEAMKEVEISMEDVGKGVGGETTRGGNDTTQTRRW
jgi:hypothetical protein